MGQNVIGNGDSMVTQLSYELKRSWVQILHYMPIQ